jgi:hypothetical protein
VSSILETTANQMLTDCQKTYDQQIEQYKHELDNAMQQTQRLQTQLVDFQNELSIDDRKSKETIELLKDDHERQYAVLTQQLQQWQEQGRIVRAIVDVCVSYSCSEVNYNRIANEREEYYQSLIKQYQITQDQTCQELEHVRQQLLAANSRHETDIQRQDDEHRSESFVRSTNEFMFVYRTI